MILYQKEVCEALSIPAIPKKEWDGKTSFKLGVAVTQLHYGCSAYAVCSFDSANDKKPRIKKVFATEPFCAIEKVFPVPAYMDTDIENADLDDESKKKAEELANEAKELENGGADESETKLPDNEYCFDHIHNDEEAVAFIKAYNKENNIGGKVPSKHDTIVLRLSVIYAEKMKNAPKPEDDITNANATPDPVQEPNDNEDGEE